LSLIYGMGKDVHSEARELLDKFGKDLKDVKIGKGRKTRSSGKRKSYRDEEEGDEYDGDFKTIMFNNASHKDGSYLFLEKGHWN